MPRGISIAASAAAALGALLLAPGTAGFQLGVVGGVVDSLAFPVFHDEELRAALAYEVGDLRAAGMWPELVDSGTRPGRRLLVARTSPPGVGARCFTLYSHGNGETLRGSAGRMRAMAEQLGCVAVGYEYTGYGPAEAGGNKIYRSPGLKN